MSNARLRREALAHHEAGHAIAAVELKRTILYVSVQPSGDCPGHCALGNMSTARKGLRRRIEREILILLSGPAAEAAFAGRLNERGARGDFADAIELSNDMFGSRAEQSAWLDEQYDRAEAFVAGPRRQALIRAVAAELLAYGQLGAKQVRAICRAAGNAAVAA